MPKSLSIRGDMTTESDFDSLSVELFRRIRGLVRFECAEPIRQKPDGSEDPSSQPVRVLEAVLSNATVVSDPHSKLQIKSSTKESATALAHGNRVRVERQMNVVRLLQK